MGVTSQPRTEKLAEHLVPDTTVEPISSAATRASSPVPTTFAPINRQESVATGHWNLGNVSLGAAHPALHTASKICRKRTAEHVKTPGGKRSKTATDSDHPASAKQLPITLTQTPTSFRSFKATKPITETQGLISTGKKDVISFLARAGHIPGYQPGAQIQVSTTTIEQLTPHSTRVSSSGIALCRNGIAPLAVASDIHNAILSDDSSDSYPLDDDIAEEDMVQLLTYPPGSVTENHIPPSSVQGWDHESQSAGEYDPTLKCSPPDLQEANPNAAGIEHGPETRQSDASEDLLDEDVDWNAVLANANTLQETPSIDSPPEIKASKCVNMVMYTESPGNIGHYSDEAGPLTAFVRPPFPGKVRDRPSVPGMSSDMLLRTCFRIGAMISQTACCFNHQQNVVFELYARVTYSSRETLSRKQHFQFVDLFKDQQPYPAATLTNWRIDSQLDKDSSAFLDTCGGPRLCWCVCKPIKDTKAAIGWTYTVLKIKEIDWEQIHWAKRIICGDSAGVTTKTMTPETMVNAAS
ncbi:hypothetical protein F4824DRAFT_463801 [Ustulina deusta]|nr:hypothetical protein F4824DRAFT_463801 [Ustulina deusta]